MKRFMILLIFPVFLMILSCETVIAPEADEEEKEDNKTKNLLLNPKADDGENYWTFYKAATSDCGVDLMTGNVFYIESNNNEMTYISQTVDLPAGSGGKYLLITGYGWLEDDIPGFITNHPLLWGEEYDITDNTLQYFNDANMFHDAPERTWKTIYGIYQINPAAVKARLYMEVASSALHPTNGTRTVFDDLAMIIFDTQLEAETYLEEYILQHPEVYE